MAATRWSSPAQGNNYTGGTTVSGGTLRLNNSSDLGSTSGGVLVNGGTLDINGQSVSVGGVSLSSGAIVNGGCDGGDHRHVLLRSSGVIPRRLTGDSSVTLTKDAAAALVISAAPTPTKATRRSTAAPWRQRLALRQRPRQRLRRRAHRRRQVGNVAVHGGVVAPGYAGSGGTLTAASMFLNNPGLALNYTLGTLAANNSYLYVNTGGSLTLPSSGLTLNIFDGGGLSAGTLRLIGFDPAVLVGGTGRLHDGQLSRLARRRHVQLRQRRQRVRPGDLGRRSLINGTWKTNGSGLWSGSGNWNGGVPGTGQDTAVFGKSCPAARGHGDPRQQPQP